MVYVTTCSFIIIISHDLILTCVRKPLDQNTWLPFSFTAMILYAVCAGLSAFWELTSYIKWIYFTITLINCMVFGMDSLSILWQFRKQVHSRSIILPTARTSTRQSINLNSKKEEEELPSIADPSNDPITINQPPRADSKHSVAIQCDSLEQMDLNRLPSVPSTGRYVPAVATFQVPTSTTYTHYHKRKRHGCHGCHACDPINNINMASPTAGGSSSSHMGPNSFIGGGARPATTAPTYGGTFHVSKDIAPLSSPAGSGRQNAAGSSTHKMKSPWTNESLYVWEAKPTRFGDDGEDIMKRY